MYTLDLTSLKEKSGYVQYKIEYRKDGQQDIVITGFIDQFLEDDGRDSSWIYKLRPLKTDHSVFIISHFKSFKDLEIIIGAVASLRRLGITNIELFIPYMLGARGDRDFTDGKGGNSYLCEVVAPVINNLRLNKVYSIDVHNPGVTSAAIYNFINLPQSSLLHWVTLQEEFKYDEFALVSPDSGAYKKIYDTAQVLKNSKHVIYNGEVINAIKHRDLTTNEVSSTTLLYDGKIDKNLIIVDDLCDGGRTFIDLAAACRRQMAEGTKLYLVITHGVFSYGTKCLTDVFDGVYCTNSYSSLGTVQGNSNKIETVKQQNILNYFNEWNMWWKQDQK